VTNQQRQALERFREHRRVCTAMEHPANSPYTYVEVSTGAAGLVPEAVQKDMATIIGLCLEEHRADDGDAVTEDWLRAVGFRTADDGATRWLQKADLELHSQSPHGWKTFVGSRMLRPVSTRGQLRGLCHWLCIALREPPHAPPPP
jgi:hypothetical protein